MAYLTRKGAGALLCAALAIGAVVVFVFNPVGTWWMPKCPFLMLTGLKCPSCGNTRAMHQLMHGHVDEAFVLNPFLFVALPLFVLIGYAYFFRPRWAGGRSLSVMGVAYIALYCIWWVIRNVFDL